MLGCSHGVEENTGVVVIAIASHAFRKTLVPEASDEAIGRLREHLMIGL